MGKAIANLEHIRGETITFGLRSSDPAFDGSEVIACDLKKAKNGNQVPGANEAVEVSTSVSFVPAAGDTPAAWHMTVTPAQSAALAPGNYITDAKIVFSDGSVDYPKPLVLQICERVTA